jgi:FixJ family two-component response regulator
MPGQDGLWLAGELRRRYPLTGVILTANSAGGARPMTIKGGVLAFLFKPFAKAPLVEALGVALKWHHETKEQGPRLEDHGPHLQEWLDSLRPWSLSRELHGRRS